MSPACLSGIEEAALASLIGKCERTFGFLGKVPRLFMGSHVEPSPMSQPTSSGFEGRRTAWNRSN